MDAHEAEQLFQQAVSAYRQNNFAVAARHCRRLLKINPDHPGVLQLAGIVALREKRAKKAVEYLSKAAQLQPQDPGVHSNLALALTAAGQRSEAMACYGQVIALKPDHSVAHFNLGQLLLQDAQYPDAVLSLTKAAKQQPKSAEVHAVLGQAQRLAGDLPAAISAFRTSLSLDRKNANNLAMLANALGEQDRSNFADAAALYREALDIAPKQAEIWSNLAWTLCEIGDLNSAKEAAETAINLDPKSAAAHYHLGLIEMQRAGGRAAEKALRQAIRLNSRYVRAYSALALVLEDLQEHAAVAQLADPKTYVKGFLIDELMAIPSVADFNDRFVDFVHQHPTLMFERPNRATTGGSQTLDLVNETAPIIKSFHDAIDEAVRQYLTAMKKGAANSYFRQTPKTWHKTIWAVVLRSGGYQAPHNHPTGFISGVYYPKVPAIVGQAGEAGFIEFGPSNVTGADDQQLSSALRFTGQPTPGRMFLFPSYMWHRTIPYESDEERISVAFDILWRG
jgi:uncharacterized protein (TIGR02466 family)